MDFTASQPSIVRDIRQRALVNGWLQLAKVKCPPTRDQFHAERFQDKEQEFGFYAVVRQDDGRMRFRIEHDGNFLARAFGSTGRGQFIDEYVAPNLVPVLSPAYRECADPQTSGLQRSENHRRAGQGRLLSAAADAVRRRANDVNWIITSLKAFSGDGPFELGNLLSGVYSTPETEVAAVIEG